MMTINSSSGRGLVWDRARSQAVCMLVVVGVVCQILLCCVYVSQPLYVSQPYFLVLVVLLCFRTRYAGTRLA